MIGWHLLRGGHMSLYKVAIGLDSLSAPLCNPRANKTVIPIQSRYRMCFHFKVSPEGGSFQ